jgi:hypothetical protein
MRDPPDAIALVRSGPGPPGRSAPRGARAVGAREHPVGLGRGADEVHGEPCCDDAKGAARRPGGRLRAAAGGRLARDPRRSSLRLLPSGPDRVGESPVHDQPSTRNIEPRRRLRKGARSPTSARPSSRACASAHPPQPATPRLFVDRLRPGGRAARRCRLAGGGTAGSGDRLSRAARPEAAGHRGCQRAAGAPARCRFARRVPSRGAGVPRPLWRPRRLRDRPRRGGARGRDLSRAAGRHRRAAAGRGRASGLRPGACPLAPQASLLRCLRRADGDAQAGHCRRCEACGFDTFPRTDPAVICLVVSGDHCLLGRSRHFPEGMFSTLAGFVEPGESLEQTIFREIREEVGIEVTACATAARSPGPSRRA